uniref:MARVEL domain-containing protein n=1 Tax=Panagrellus redivivus TaxID=6233 RepID=A0A7E4ZUH2_PANRE
MLMHPVLREKTASSGMSAQPPNARQETFTTQQPDGTFVTHTTTVREKYVEEDVIGFGPGKVNEKYCCKPPGILRIVEIILCFLIICLITSVYGPGPFKGVLAGQTMLLIFAGIAFCWTFILLATYFFNLQITHLDNLPWSLMDLLFSGFFCIFFLIFGFVEAYYSTGAWSNNCNDIGGDGIIHNGCRFIYEWGFAAFFCFINAALYGFSAFFARRKDEFNDDLS